MLHDISLAELAVVLSVIEAKAVRAAARSRNLKPSHVSKIVSRVERQLGVQLLVRSASGMVLTREGMAFKSAARELLAKAEELSALKLGSTSALPLPVLTFAAVPFLNKSLLAPATGALEREIAGLRFRMLELSPDLLLGAGLKGAIDAAVHIGPLTWTKLWTTKRVGALAWSVYSRAGHPVGAVASAAEIAAFPFIVPMYWTGSEFSPGDDYCPLSWDERRKGHEVSSAEAALEIVRVTDELAFVPRVVARNLKEFSEVVEVSVDGWDEVTRPVHLSVRSDRVKQSQLAKIVKTLQSRLA